MMKRGIFLFLCFPYICMESTETEVPIYRTEAQENDRSFFNFLSNYGTTIVNDKLTGKSVDSSDILKLSGEENEVNVGIKPVLRKCCPFGEELRKQGCAISEKYNLPFHPIIYHSSPYIVDTSVNVTEVFNIVFGDPCNYGRYRLEPQMEPTDEFYLLDNGSLWLPAIPVMLNGAEEFCMEIFFPNKEEDGEMVILPLVCFPPPEENEEQEDELAWILYPVGLLISVPFLLITLILHIVIPEMRRSLQGKSFMCHVISLTVAYIGLASIQLSKSMLPIDVCVSIAFVVQFAFISCFAWLNVMCFDIWRRIGKESSLSQPYNTQEKSNRKIFLWYSIYAWSCPILIIIVSMVMDLTPSIPASYIKPQFGVASCWFLSNDSALPYFYGPIGVMIFINITLFVLTAKKIFVDHKRVDLESRPRGQVHVMSLRNFNRTIKLCFTLFILMGVNWTMEIISWAAGNRVGKILKGAWYITDMCNSLQGVFIFIIFIADTRVRNLAKQKLKNLGCCSLCIQKETRNDSYNGHLDTVDSILLSEVKHEK